MTPKDYIRGVLEYTVGAPVETGDLKLFNELVDKVYNGGDFNRKIIKKFKKPIDLLDYVKDNLERKPNEKMLALYESTVEDIMNVQTEKCFKTATMQATRGILTYSALGLLLSNPQDVYKLDLMSNILKLLK